jgi:hypothetical protein
MRWTTDGQTGVFVSALKPQASETSVLLATCVQGHSERLQVRNQAIHVLEILRFSMSDRVFAYRVSAQLMSVQGKRRVPLASEVMLTFYDEEGSGKFTLMQYPGQGLTPRLDVPDWVKNLSH